MKSIITSICLLLSITVFSQFKGSVSTLSGYEENITKAPDNYFTNDILKSKNDLYQTSFYQDGILKLNYKKQLNDGQFKVRATPSIRYYFTEPNINRILFTVGASYSHLFNKKHKWETRVRYKLKDQKGENLDEPELSTPLGYNMLSATTGLHTRLYKNNRTFIRASYDIKNFDKSATRNLSYNRYGAFLRFLNYHKVDGKRHKAGFRASFLNRDYTLDYFTKGYTRNRTWQYLNAGVFYNFPILSNFSIEPALDFEKRTDVTNKKYGYNQLKPSLGLIYKNDKVSAKLTTSYSSRKFDALKASSTEEKNIADLTYKYTKLTLKGRYKLNEDIYILTDNYLLDRKTNNTNVKTKAYRSYNKYYTGLGVRYNF